MKKQHKIIIGVVVTVVVIGLFFYFKAKKNSRNGNTVGNFIAGTGSAPGIPDEVQKELPWHEEGEQIRFQGVKYKVVDGQWVKLS